MVKYGISYIILCAFAADLVRALKWAWKSVAFFDGRMESRAPVAIGDYPYTRNRRLMGIETELTAEWEWKKGKKSV